MAGSWNKEDVKEFINILKDTEKIDKELWKYNQFYIDTNAYTSFKKGDIEAIKVIQHVPSLYINSIVIGELLAGFSLGSRTQMNLDELNEFLTSPRVIFIDIDYNTADNYAKIFKQLREKGKPIPTNDLWIAASALQHDLTLFTYDKHFRFIDGLDAIQSIEY